MSSGAVVEAHGCRRECLAESAGQGSHSAEVLAKLAFCWGLSPGTCYIGNQASAELGGCTLYCLYCRAARTLLYYLTETNLTLHNWLFMYLRENPIPQVPFHPLSRVRAAAAVRALPWQLIVRGRTAWALGWRIGHPEVVCHHCYTGGALGGFERREPLYSSIVMVETENTISTWCRRATGRT